MVSSCLFSARNIILVENKQFRSSQQKQSGETLVATIQKISHQIMKKILDYNYYLFVEKFKAIEKEKVITFVTIFQYLFIVNLTLFIMLFFATIKQLLLPILIFCVVAFFWLRFYNRKKYNGRYTEIEANWNNENEQKKSFYKKIVWTLVLVAFCLMIINSQSFPEN